MFLESRSIATVGEITPGGMSPASRRKVELEPHEVFQAVWQKRWTAFWTVVGCLAAAGVYLKLATPVYTATSRLYVVPDLADPGAQIGWRERSKNYLSTQCELLASAPILDRVAQRPDVQKMETFVGVRAIAPALKHQLKVALGNKDDLIEVSLDSTNPEEAAAVVNAVVESYVAYQSSQKRTSATEMLKILRREKEAREQELADKRLAVVNFKRQNPELSFQDHEGGIILRRLAQLSEAKTTAQLQVMEAKAAYESVRAALSDPLRRRQVATSLAVDDTQTAADRGRAEIQSALYEAQVKLVIMRRQLAPGHHSVTALADSIVELQRALNQMDLELATARLASLEQAAVAATQRLTSIEEAFQKQQQEASALNSSAAELAILESSVQQAQKLVDGIEARIKELGLGGETGALNVTVLEPAVAADEPSKPRKPLVLVAAGLLGVVLGSFLAFVLASTDKKLRSSQQVEDVLGVPVLTSVPWVKRRWSTPGGALRPGSEAADAYRVVRAALQFGNRGHAVKTLLVTSAVKGEGKSTLAANLAVAMAQGGERTLLIDADLRRPSLHETFKVENVAGLSTILEGKFYCRDGICRTGIDGLDLLPSGPVPSNPAAMLSSVRFRGLLSQLSKGYDRIVLDAPPVLGMADALVLGALCDTTLLVVRAEVSDRRTTEAALAALVNIGVRSLATVVNGARPGDGYSRYARGYFTDVVHSSPGGRGAVSAEVGAAKPLPGANAHDHSGNGTRLDSAVAELLWPVP